jgi:lantibiotic biosynthesis protein
VYRAVDAAILRAPAVSPILLERWPDLTGSEASPAGQRAWLRQAWSLPGFAAAMAVASPVLAGQVERAMRTTVAPRDLQRTVLSITRYLLRATTRPTPFGRFAGIAPVRLSGTASWRLGDKHRARIRPDAGWLHEVIARLEADVTLRPHLPVAATNLATVRDGRLVLAWHARGEGVEPESVSVRHTSAVKAVMSAAAYGPIRVGVLASMLTAARGADAEPRAAEDLLAALISTGFLITSLRPPATATDPLRHLRDALSEAIGTADNPEMTEITDLLASIGEAADRVSVDPDASATHADLSVSMTTLAEHRRLFGIDLHLDYRNVRLPEQVTAEAATAATLLVRLARRPMLATAWTDWHRRFLERYGPRAVAPVVDAVDSERGIGYPAGYRDHAPAPRNLLDDRDIKLLALAQNAVLERRVEIELNDAAIDELSVLGADVRVQPHSEITAHLHAATTEALAAGQFQLTVLSASRAAGTVTGRFLDLLDPDDAERMMAAYNRLPTATAGAIRAQLSAPTPHIGTGNITRAPRALDHLIALGEHHCRRDGLINVDDLAVAAAADRLCLVSLSRGVEIEPTVLNAVEMVWHAHPLVRFLCELPTALHVPCDKFSWGPAAGALPFLPALRYGRIVLSPARWLLDAAEVPDAATSWPEWISALHHWRDARGVPPTVWLGEGDVRLLLDLTESAHLAVLRAELGRSGRVRLTQPPAPGAGWLDGIAHEIVIPVAATTTPATSRTWASEPTGRDHGHVPGAGRWLYAKLYAHPERQTTVLTAHLPRLLAAFAPELTPTWWFLRYRDPEPHLRLRIATVGDFAAAAARLAAWAEDLRGRGLVGQVQLDTYFPETGRFGTGNALAAAEDYFAADSAAAVAQLRARRPGGANIDAVTAASIVNLVIAAHDGSTDDGLRWLIDHTATTRPAPSRAVYDQAIAMAEPTGSRALAVLPDGAQIAESWQLRRQALSVWSQQHEVTELLPDLIHLHHVRVSGTSDSIERTRLHLARAAALSWNARRSGAK